MTLEEGKEGAYLNRMTFVLFYHTFGVHPVTMPWMFVNASSEEMLEALGQTQEMAPEELPAK